MAPHRLKWCLLAKKSIGLHFSENKVSQSVYRYSLPFVSTVCNLKISYHLVIILFNFHRKFSVFIPKWAISFIISENCVLQFVNHGFPYTMIGVLFLYCPLKFFLFFAVSTRHLAFEYPAVHGVRCNASAIKVSSTDPSPGKLKNYRFCMNVRNQYR